LGDGEFEYSLKDHDNELDESDEDIGMIDLPGDHDLHDHLLSWEGSDELCVTYLALDSLLIFVPDDFLQASG
jgi:hypothetical protein